MSSCLEKLEELYKMAVGQQDVCQAMEIVDKIKAEIKQIAADKVKTTELNSQVKDERIQKFIDELDAMVANAESGSGETVYCFDYGGQKFEVEIK